MAFVQSPGVLDGDPHPVKPVERDPEGADRALQDRGEGEVKGVPFLAEKFAGLARFLLARLTQIDVGPA